LFLPTSLGAWCGAVVGSFFLFLYIYCVVGDGGDGMLCRSVVYGAWIVVLGVPMMVVVVVQVHVYIMELLWERKMRANKQSSHPPPPLSHIIISSISPVFETFPLVHSFGVPCLTSQPSRKKYILHYTTLRPREQQT